METVKIRFLNGEEIEAEVNGTSYITDEEPDFPGDLAEVVLTNESNEETTLSNVNIVECASVDGRYWFTLQEIPESDIEKDRMDAQVLYTAIMTDTLLEED